MTRPQDHALHGITVLERGWLSSNNVLLHGVPGEGATLIDSGHCTHATQTVALVKHALVAAAQGQSYGPAPLRRLVNTHLHSDHCGGNAALQDAYPGLPVDVPPASLEAVRSWDQAALSFRPTGQRCVRFVVRGTLQPGDSFAVGARRWDILAAAGHDPDAVMLFDARNGILVSADALWGNGFGVVFPELEGRSAFDDAAGALDTIERLGAAWVIPGHGPPFEDVAAALARARRRLASWRGEPLKHARHGARVLIKYHLMEERELPWEAALDWAEATPLMRSAWQKAGRQEDASPRGWAGRLIKELVASGALAIDGAVLRDS